MDEILKNYLRENGVEGVLHEHPQVYRVEEAEQICSHIPGIAGKNLFLRNEKKTRYFLVIVAGAKRVRLESLAKKLDEKRLSFASPEDLLSLLCITPGSVSPFCLIHESAKTVEVCIDEEVFHAPLVNFHPNSNTASFVMTGSMFQKFLDSVSNPLSVIEIPIAE